MAAAYRIPLVEAPVPVDLRTWSYVDAFGVAASSGDGRCAEEWIEAGLVTAPAVVRSVIRFAQSAVLRFELAPSAAERTILGWRVVESSPDRTRLAAESPLMSGVILCIREPGRGVLITALDWRRPRAARVTWAVIGPVHRVLAPVLLRRASGRTTPSPK